MKIALATPSENGIDEENINGEMLSIGGEEENKEHSNLEDPDSHEDHINV